jgi:hypothetical protein
MDIQTRQIVWRTSLMLRREAWQRHRRLVREIAEYRTPSERDDLLAAVDHCPNAAREEIRRMLMRAAVRAELECTPFPTVRLTGGGGQRRRPNNQ